MLKIWGHHAALLHISVQTDVGFYNVASETLPGLSSSISRPSFWFFSILLEDTVARVTSIYLAV